MAQHRLQDGNIMPKPGIRKNKIGGKIWDKFQIFGNSEEWVR